MEPLKTPTTGKDFFLHLAAIIALYVSFGSLVALVFNYINYLFPDALTDSYYYYDPYSSSVRFAISMLLIVFPTFLGLTYYINRELRNYPEKKYMWVRRWTIYLTVFLAGGIIIGDLVTLINTFLNGEVSGRFLGKVLSLLLISGFVMSYYINDIREVFINSITKARIFGVSAIVLVFGAVIAGFFIVGTPADARNRQFDQQKISDLQNIQWQIVNYWQRTESMPENLSQLADPIGGYQVPKDRQTGESYKYELTGTKSYKFCATFNLKSSDRAYPVNYGKGQDLTSPYPLGSTDAPEFWKYEKGETCFTRTIDPKLYPPIKR